MDILNRAGSWSAPEQHEVKRQLEQAREALLRIVDTEHNWKQSPDFIREIARKALNQQGEK